MHLKLYYKVFSLLACTAMLQTTYKFQISELGKAFDVSKISKALYGPEIKLAGIPAFVL